MTQLSFKQLQGLPYKALSERFDDNLKGNALFSENGDFIDYPFMAGYMKSLCLQLVFGDTYTKINAKQQVLKFTGCSQKIHTKKGV